MSEKSDIASSNNTVPLCPIGEESCSIIDRLVDVHSHNQILSEQVRIDALTGLFNYRYFNHALSLEMERTRRTGQPCALMMLDLDHFKKVNDRLGHEGGNKALVSTAEVLKQTTRQLDVVCRYGGEEFAIIMPCVDLVMSKQIANRIREAIASAAIMYQQYQINLTASFGIAIYDGYRAEHAEQFVTRADSFLYQAKVAGRNCVCHEIKEMDGQRVAVSDEEKDVLFDLFTDDQSSR